MQNKYEKLRSEAKTPDQAYLATIGSIEPDITSVDVGAFCASAAISLKRIADSLDLLVIAVTQDHQKKDKNMRDWATRHGFGDLWDNKS